MHYANNLFKFLKDIKFIFIAGLLLQTQLHTYYCYLQYDIVILSQKLAHQNM